MASTPATARLRSSWCANRWRAAATSSYARSANAPTLPPSSKRSVTNSIQAQKRSCWSWPNFNIHGVASLYAAFPPAEARRLAGRLEIHHTPKHGSWLNMAEIELSVLARQCLAERRDNQDHLNKEVAAWEHARNHAATRIHWRFTTADARLKLQHLYPQTLPC